MCKHKLDYMYQKRNSKNEVIQFYKCKLCSSKVVFIDAILQK